MPLQIVLHDITTMNVDAIVNAANESLLGGGGVDGAIHRAAGPDLLKECRTLGGCPTGQAKITKGYRLNARYVIHTVGPIWRGGGRGERELLVSAYRSSLSLALAHDCRTVAFPLISSGAYGYPRDQALKTAVDTIGDFLLSHDMTVYLVIFDRAACCIDSGLFDRLSGLMDVQTEQDRPAPDRASRPAQPDESFSQMLLRKIGEAGMTGAQCCRKANFSSELFPSLCSDVRRQPSKSAAMAFAVALELSPEEADVLLRTAGFSLSPASRSDRIVSFFLAHHSYNIFELNAALFAFGQDQLGG